MSGLDVAAIHTAVATQIEAGIADAGKFTVVAFPSTSPRPCIEVWPDSEYLTYFETFGSNGRAVVRLLIRVFLSGGNAETEWKQVARLVSAGTGFTSSIVDAVVEAPSFSGASETARLGTAHWNPEDGSIDYPLELIIKKSGAAA